MQEKPVMRERKIAVRSLGCHAWLAGGVGIVALLCLSDTALAFAESPALEDVRLAYLDPGSGSFVVQALIAMFAGIVVTLRLYWARFKGLLGLGTAGRDDGFDGDYDDHYEDHCDDDDYSHPDVRQSDV